MKQKEILKHIKNIMNSFNNEYNYILDYKLKCGVGYCEDFYVENKTIHIGCRELKGVFNKDLEDKNIENDIKQSYLYNENKKNYQLL